ncbi:MAG TPA: hypothetical protein PKD78_03510, partial [Saprospiraceae bacterium]|nr:hypothetical protein [Saprospiraceae bacterium]
NGNTLRIRILPANKSNAEVYWFDNVTVNGTAAPTVNPPADVTACAGATVTTNFTGTGNPTFNWTNNNTAIGLAASGSGNISFTAANVATPTTAAVTVTPVAAGCTGMPETFDILINPVPTVNQPPNISVCSGDFVEIIFSGSSSTATYNWTANIPFFQPSGQGNITGTVPPLPFPITGSITVTPTENGCTGMPKTFTVSAYPAPSAEMTMTNGPLFCAGQNANFSVNFTNGNAPYTFTYALNGVNQPPVTTNSDPYNFSLTLTADVTVSAVSVTTGVGCTVNATGSFQVEVTPTPTATLTGGNSTICQGQMLDLTVNFNGTDTYTFVYSLNNVNQPPISTQGPTYTLSVEPPLGTSTYRLVSVSSNGCTGTATGMYTVTNIPSPNATITGSPSVCAGQPATVTVNLSGAAPYTFIYSLNGVPQPSVTTSTSPYNVTGTYPTTTVIELESVTSGTCTGNTSGTATVTVNPAPTASFQTASTVVCSGQPANINVAFTGNAPFTFIYSVGGANQPAVTTSANPYVLTVSPPATTTYTLVSVVSGTCIGTATGSHVVSIGGSLDAVLSADTTICSGRSAPLTFTFTGPTPPYTIEYTANLMPQPPITATSNPFIFNVSPTETTAYEITAVSAGSCQGTFSGLGLVIVDPSASATLESGNDTICSGTKDTLLVTFTGAPGPYSFVYALNGKVVDTITTTNLDTFYRLPIMPPVGRDTFTLINVSSPSCAGGAVSGKYIYWVKPTPLTDLQGDVSVCLGNEGTLVFDFSGDTVWTANYTADGVPQPPLVTIKDPDTIKVTPTATTTFILTDVTSSNGCTFSQPDTVVMAVNPGATATIDSVEVSFCAGASDTTHVTLGGGAPYTLVYSINGLVQAPVVTNGPTYSIIRTPASGTTEVIRLVSVNSPGCNGSTVEGMRTITAKPVPTAHFQTDSSVICGAGNARIVVDFTGGGGPWVLEYTIDGLQQFPLTTVKDPDTLNVFVQQNTVFGITGVSLDGCADATADQHVVTVADSLKAVLSGGGQVCQNGTGADLRVDFVGQGPYTFTYQYMEMGMNKLVTVTTAQNPYIFRLNPSNGKVYTLASVNNGICNGSVSGLAVIFVFTPPTAEMSGSKVFCDSAATNIMVDFTGTGPFAITYTIDGVPVGPDTTFEDPYLIPVNVKQTTNFVLTGVQSPGCIGTVAGNATLTVNYSPKPSNLSVACNPALGTYVVTFNTTGTPPFVLQAGAGNFTGNTFTSNPIPVGTPYTITYRDAGNCSPATLTGLEDCSCQTDAGNMSQSTETVCQDQPVSVPTSLGSSIDNNDTLIYILHTNPGLPLGQIFASNAVPTFTFQPGMQTEVTYYISAMAGDRLANGFVDTTDLCLSVATGTP